MQAIFFGDTHVFVPEALAEDVDYTWRDSSKFGILDGKAFVSLLLQIEQDIVYPEKKNLLPRLPCGQRW